MLLTLLTITLYYGPVGPRPAALRSSAGPVSSLVLLHGLGLSPSLPGAPQISGRSYFPGQVRGCCFCLSLSSDRARSADLLTTFILKGYVTRVLLCQALIRGVIACVSILSLPGHLAAWRHLLPASLRHLVLLAREPRHLSRFRELLHAAPLWPRFSASSAWSLHLYPGMFGSA